MQSILLGQPPPPCSNTEAVFSFLPCFAWYRRQAEGDAFVSRAVDLAAGGLCFAAMYPQNFNGPHDPTCVIPDCRAALGRVCRQAGYLHELVEKWNGVYNPLYFQGRIREQLSLGKPVLFWTASGRGAWHILLSMDEAAASIRCLSPEGQTIEIAEWYERMEGLLLLCPQRSARQNGWDTIALVRSALAHRKDSYTGFWVGEAAYSAWLHDVRVQSPDSQNFAMCERLAEARSGALELIRLLSVQFPDAQKLLNSAAGELTQMLGLLESTRRPDCRAIEEIARLDGHAIHCLEQILFCRPAQPLFHENYGFEYLEKEDASCECS